MRRDISAINVFSTLVAFMAGAVLCMQIANLHQLPGLSYSAALLYGVELAVFGTALSVWQPGARLLGWALGVAFLMATRLALTATAGLGLSFVEANTDLTAAFRTTSALAPRAGAVLFSLMVVYPLRSLVAPKEVPLPRKRGRQPAGGSKAGPPSSPQDEDDRGLLIVSLSDRAASPEQPKQAPPPASDLFIPAPVPQADIAIEVPVSALLAELPLEMVTDEARALDDGRSVVLPSDRVLHQLREAHVLLSVQEIIELLPHRMRKALSQPPDVNLESDTVSIPLELIVPQIPLDAFALPAPTPPTWAEVEEADTIVFATVPMEQGQ